MATLTFEEARACVVSKLAERPTAPGIQAMTLLDTPGRVLAEPISADRDFPAADRSVRDGFAVRSADLPGTLDIVGEVRAGTRFTSTVGAGQAVEIMTGAPMPAGADAVIMIEHVSVNGTHVTVERRLRPGENINLQGSEVKQGALLLAPGDRLGFAEIAVLATVGRRMVSAYERPRIAIIATGDEVVTIEAQPAAHEVRNSNSYSLAAQVLRAGGTPVILPVAKDDYEATRQCIEEGFESDLLLLSGGVSAGKYDIVEKVLADLNAEFYFDRVLIQPGQPLVFGRAQDRFFFGLPGNPASTMVTFELFARVAVEMLGGRREPPLLPLLWTRLSCEFKQKTGLTRFLPARLSLDGSEITPVPWQGSSDVAALARANAFLVTEPDRESWKAGEWIRVLLK